MVLDANVVLGEVLIEISLQVVVRERIAFLVLGVLFTLDLQTLIGQVHKSILGLKTVSC